MIGSLLDIEFIIVRKLFIFLYSSATKNDLTAPLVSLEENAWYYAFQFRD